jgi:putative heme-binding domain-containing protein
MNRFFRATLGLAVLLLSPAALRADELETLPDFKVDLVLKADKTKHGSWINLGKDGKGRLYLSGQNKQPVTRLTLKDGKIEKEEVLQLPVSEIMGTCWAFDALYVNGSGPGGKFGLYRLTEKEEGKFTAEMLREWQGGHGEHGAHGIVLSPDGQHLFIVCGNFVSVPDDILKTSPHRNYQDDVVLPRAEDGNGFGAGKKPPGGFIVSVDKDGKNCELFASGQRNTYDIAFNGDGELFGFDSDMEWDWGMPWYRPIRAFHAVSGGDTGFREGSAKWPEYYADSLPPVVNIGIGSPTGVAFGTGAKFPLKYQKAFYMLDWTYGRVIAVHLKPNGAGYTGDWENFVAPKSLKTGKDKAPNNVTDIVIGDDGALYFTTGGRNSAANLYRVTYTGKESTAGDVTNKEGAEARNARHDLEKYHHGPNPRVVGIAWPQLSSNDRFIRYAARIAIERQPVEEWKDKALSEQNPQAAMTGLLALARCSDLTVQPAIFDALAKFPIGKLTDEMKLEKLRVIEVTIARQGVPSSAIATKLVAELSPLYPAQSWPLNRELCQTLIALSAPDAVAKTMKLLGESKVQEEQIGYVFYLRLARVGWTPELRKTYFSWYTTRDRSGLTHVGDTLKWFQDAGRPYADGSSFAKFIARFHTDAVNQLSPEETASLQPVLSAYKAPDSKAPPKAKKEYKFVKKWEQTELEPLVKDPLKGRSFEKGRDAFLAAQCLACHKFGNEGGAIGPDLTALSSRFSRRDVLESIIEPSKVVSEQYAATDVRLNNGDVVSGRILEDKPDSLIVLQNPLKPSELTVVKKADIKSTGLSKLSPMPQGLVDILTKEEILDLIAYIESGGSKSHGNFGK